VFPTRGKVDAFSVTEQDVAEYERLYPGLDVRCELRKALAWIRASPDRMKTAKGMPRFIVNWLNRATERPAVSRVDHQTGALDFDSLFVIPDKPSPGRKE